MKFSSTEEYGLRCMLQMAKKGQEGTTTIVELAQKEALTPAYVAKIMSVLRKGNLVKSIRGQSGGYQLARPAPEINVNEVVEVLGGKFFSREEYCSDATPGHRACLHSMDCAIRSLWTGLDAAITGYLGKCRLSDLVRSERDMEKWVGQAQSRAFVPLAQTGLQEKVKEGTKIP
jgi:Rrf2 family protein